MPIYFLKCFFLPWLYTIIIAIINTIIIADISKIVCITLMCGIGVGGIVVVVLIIVTVETVGALF